MAADWEFDLPMNDDARQLVLGKLRGMRVAVPPTSSCLADVLASFEEQVASGQVRIRLPLGRFGTGNDAVFPLLHLSQLLTTFSPAYGEVRCTHCNGSGMVRLPEAVQGLHGALDARYHLGQISEPDRAEFLEWPADRVAREKIRADRLAEAERKAAAKRARENRRVLPPGSVLDDSDTGDSGFSPRDRGEFVPASALRGR